MQLTEIPLSRALWFYRRLCHVQCYGTARLNRISGLAIVREALEGAPGYWRVMTDVREVIETDSLGVAARTGIQMGTASMELLQLWKEMIEWHAADHTMKDWSEHIFLERRVVTLAKGGLAYRYRLSALGELVMANDAREGQGWTTVKCCIR